ncbi:MAG TPA: histidine phosphatase family protein [Ktedonobacteraceae bacterium]
MTLFYLIRHGKKEAISGDAPLSPSGLKQARATAQFLQERTIQHVYTSPLRRAKETTACIASVQSLPVVEDGRLRERANWGDLPGQSFTEFLAMWERSTHDPDYLPPVGDSARQAGARMEQFLREVAKTAPAEEIVVVTHGGLITDFLVATLPLEQLEQWHPTFLAVKSSLIPECSITVIRREAEQYVLQCLAEVKHLPERTPRQE